MIKLILISIVLHGSCDAGFMDNIGNLVESTLSDDDNEISTVQTVGTLSVKTTKPLKKKYQNDDSLLDSMVSNVQSTMGINEKKKDKDSSLTDKIFIMVKDVVGMDKIESDHSFFNGGVLGNVADMIELEKGESLGLPSVFGLNKKKNKIVFGSTILGNTFLGDIKETSSSFYRGFKNTGESTEFMSGVMYRSSKLYNGMFEIFDESPMNIFDNKNEREPSIFDILDKGNSMLDIMD